MTKTPLECAIAEIGTKESPRNSNRVKYNDWYYGRAVSGDAYPWCMAFAQWCFGEAGIPLPFKTASCSALLNWYKANYPECIVKDPCANDIAIFSFGHTGIVESAKGEYVTCIEGNTSSTSASNGGEVMRATRPLSQVSGFIRPLALLTDKWERDISGVHLSIVRAEDWELKMGNCPKLGIFDAEFYNAGFFGRYQLDNGEIHTAPAGMLICDDKQSYPARELGCERRNSKLYHPTPKNDTQFYGKRQTVFLVKDGVADIIEASDLKDFDYADYLVAGIPIMRDGEDVVFKTFVRGQGWTGAELRPTKHVFLGLKDDPSIVYTMEFATTTDNMISTAEAFRKFKALGLKDVIKLDGGGSFVRVTEAGRSTTSENRQINSYITFTRHKPPDERKKNPYGWPTKLVQYKLLKNDEAFSIQWALTELGYDTGGIDGYFWNKSVKAVKAFQTAEGLEADGIVGKLTLSALRKYFK